MIVFNQRSLVAFLWVGELVRTEGQERVGFGGHIAASGWVTPVYLPARWNV